MKPRVYIETTVISYLTARPARDVVVAGHQQSTRDWWERASDRFELVVSELVRQESGMGDRHAARARLSILASLVTLDATAEADGLAEALVRNAAVPQSAIRNPRRRTHRYRRRQRGRVPRNLEFPPSRERGGKAAHRVRVPPSRFRAAHHLHSRGTDGGHRQ